MKYLLDMNALVALGFVHHEFHRRVASWVRAHHHPTLATCAITELGFVRVLSQASAYNFTVAHARTLLIHLKETKVLRFVFLPDDHDISQLPGWVKTPRHTTDGHLVELARANGGVLATLDGRIPGAYLIPES